LHRPVNPQVAPQQVDDPTASMRTRIPAFVTIELADAFVYRSICCLSDVDDGFVLKPSLPFVFKIKVKGRERVVQVVIRIGEVDERQGTRFATDRSITDPSHHINTCA